MSDLPPPWYEPSERAGLRIWHGFATARVMVALAVLLLQLLVHLMGQDLHPTFIALCVVYLGATLFVRIAMHPRSSETPLSRLWVPTIGTDLIAFSAMQMLQPGGMNYTPLLGLPVLMAAVLGTRRTALATTAAVTLLLLAEVCVSWLRSNNPLAAQFAQAGLTGTGYFLVTFLVHPVAARLAREENLAREGQQSALVQAQVNEVVIASLGDGVLVLDDHDNVRAANPAARVLLDQAVKVALPFSLAGSPAWRPLVELARRTFAQGAGGDALTADVALEYEGSGPRRLHLRARLTPPRDFSATQLCVMFLEDQRESEARLRTEKLAAMGRMSAAVAHEIRNPLAAIVQANQLLDEELTDPSQKRLAQMVRQNAQRLARITEEVLDVSRAQQQFHFDAATIALDDTAGAVCLDWHVQAGKGCSLQFVPGAPRLSVEFDGDHLRRILINLLDNALRYISSHDDALQVRTWTTPSQALLEVWSDGAPLEPTVAERLFEPFFSSDSRSSGLGLYICRELCDRHGAAIGYRRIERPTSRGMLAGNAFTLAFRPFAVTPATLPFDTIAP
ncbi:PAS domain-containing sensor histidine kinase [Xylophilus rhododendri]|uniref:histidine kinase n=1 Tax=Xylophilus rhododendri TaxID=2697032 RepID=A0A857J9C0_9BURK|nr:HAMP domain-containing sensor histidine kinase [Xylophilus rhododendri]QHI99823.1 PAS domain-containing sensor histidine kinase [Xylophilus rhododendri]